MAAKGRIFGPKGKSFLMLAYCGPKTDGSWGEIRESAKTDDEAAARTLLNKRLREVANARDGIADFETAAAKKTTVGNLLDDVVAHWKEKEIKGLAQAEYRIETLRTNLGHRLARSIDAQTVREYVAKRRAAGLANASINREVEILRKGFRLAVREGRLSKIPGFPERLPENNVRSGFFTQEEVDSLLPHLPAPLDDLVRFAFRTGWRRGELLGLRWENVAKSEVVLTDSKNGERRTLPIDGDEMASLFARLRRAREYETASGPALSAYVFHRSGQAINKTTFGKQWRRACVAARLGSRDETGRYKGRIFHDLRRSAVRAMIRAGVPSRIARSVSGHKTSSMLDRYDVTDTTDKRLALELSKRWAEAQEKTAKVAEIRR